MSVVFNVNFPVFDPIPVTERSIVISTTSPSINSVSSLILIPIDFLKACVNASVFDISSENISDAAIDVKGTSSPSSCAIAIAIAVFPVPGAPAINTARPAIFPFWIIRKITPAARRAFNWPTIPCEFSFASSLASSPSPLMCECAPIFFFKF
ncbi:hypothetical protein AYI69_g3632 [Smittium culicis]|uniref:Uncharacterized protein n=1 Tax=Smittium culicis TaxID=133412 RepID=A0A1R1YJ63_9FUNG|nr:hypothetical protein AYI69_g3632 [Smittium culicis]